MSRRFAAAALMIVVAPVACAAQEPLPGPAQRSPTPAAVAAPVRVDTVASGLEDPWGIAFLPDGRVLVTERPGRLRIADRSGALSQPLAGVPAVAARGQGGLLDVAIDPRFAENNLVYLSFSEPADDGTSGTSVVPPMVPARLTFISTRSVPLRSFTMTESMFLSATRSLSAFS